MDSQEKNKLIASLITTINTKLIDIIMALQKGKNQEEPKMVSKFRSLTKDKSQWYGLNDSDCTMNCSKVPDELKLHFCIFQKETVLFFRDTSFWNDKNQGLVITDYGLHIIYDNDSPEDVRFFTWHEIEKFNFTFVNNSPFINFSVKGEDGHISIPISFLSKGIDSCDSSKQKAVSSFLVKLLQKLADLAPCSDVNVEEVLNNATYEWNIDQDVEIPNATLLKDTILKTDIKQAEKIPELANFVDDIRQFEVIKENLNSRAASSIEHIKQSSQKAINQQMTMFNQRVVSRAGRVPTKGEAGMDLVQLGLMGLTKLAEKREIKNFERSVKIYNSMMDIIREKWIWETIEYTCSQLSLLTTTRKKLEAFHLQLLRRELKTIPAQGHEYSNMLILATSLLCHAIYLELHAKDTAEYFIDMLNNQEVTLDYLGLEDCVELELMSWPDKLKTK